MITGKLYACFMLDLKKKKKRRWRDCSLTSVNYEHRFPTRWKWVEVLRRNMSFSLFSPPPLLFCFFLFSSCLCPIIYDILCFYRHLPDTNTAKWAVDGGDHSRTFSLDMWWELTALPAIPKGFTHLPIIFCTAHFCDWLKSYQRNI